MQLEGGGSGPDKIFSEAAAMFLPGTITEDSLREVFARKAAGGSRSPRNVQKERAPTGQAPITAEAPATGNVAAAPVQPPVAATLESSPAASADVTQSDQPQRAQSGGPAGAKTQPMQKGASAGQDAAGADATLRRSSRASADFEARRDAGKPVSALSDSEYVEWIQGLLQLAVASGGDKHALAEGSASFKHGTAKSIIHSVCSSSRQWAVVKLAEALMHASIRACSERLACESDKVLSGKRCLSFALMHNAHRC